VTITNGYTDRDEVKARLGAPVASSINDDMLDHCVTAASRHIDSTCNRRFYLDAAVSARLFTPVAGHDVLIVDDIGTLTGLVVKTDDDLDGDGDTTLSASSYQAQPVNAIARGNPVTMLRYDGCWPVARAGWASIEVTAKWGWPSVPADIKEACLVAAVRLYQQRNAPGNVLGAAVDGFPTQVLGDQAPTFWRLVSPYRRHGLA
jgi:hypothetical protein